MKHIHIVVWKYHKTFTNMKYRRDHPKVNLPEPSRTPALLRSSLGEWVRTNVSKAACHADSQTSLDGFKYMKVSFVGLEF